ncbi:MAG: PAS domain-containing protein [Deltaproteobacteria bacterium]|nr:PAS domain-containing protein [Deltaproteobacteria bacterium]
MTESIDTQPSYDVLRRRAEDIIREGTDKEKGMKDRELVQLLHELEVHQIELDLQNEELRRTAKDLETARDEYLQLFNSAPVGFVVLDKKRKIERVNQTASDMLGNYLEGQPFQGMVYPDDVTEYLALTRTISKSDVKRDNDSLEMRLWGKDGGLMFVHLVVGAKFDNKGRFNQWRLAFFDISRAKEAETTLRSVNDMLEERVLERTAELQERNRELEIKTRSLMETNTALGVLFEQVEKNRQDLQWDVLCNVKQLILPYIEKLKACRTDNDRDTCLQVLETNLNNIISPFLRQMTLTHYKLTPKELHVATLVKEGKTNKDIANLLHLSVRSVEFHRDNIRNKLGLKNKKANLQSFLLSLE